MRSRARIVGHSIHPMLVVFPLGLLGTAVIFDILYLATDRTGFQIAAAYTIAAGVIGGVIAALFGLVDLSGVPAGSRAKRVGVVHGALNLLAVALFAASWLQRVGTGNWHPTAGALVCSFAGIVIAAISGWLGGELVERYGLGVREDANVDAPGVVSRRPTRGHGRLASR
jgi:uncharacterized membrane protein